MAKNPKRFLVKVSGEALAGEGGSGIDPATLERIGADIAEAAKERQIAVIVGGGQHLPRHPGPEARHRAQHRRQHGPPRDRDQRAGAGRRRPRRGGKAVALSADPMPSLCRTYYQRDADQHLLDGHVVVIGAAPGQPFFTTDTAAGPRAAELDCAAVLKATNVDGVYTADPRKDPAARRYDRLTHDEAIEKQLGVMDTAAFALARENALPIIVFSIQPGRHQQRACGARRRPMWSPRPKTRE